MRTGRPYQIAAIEAARSALKRGIRGIALELSTGTGKGFIIAAMARDCIAKGYRALVLVNRDNLCNQLHASLVEQGLLPVIERGLDKASPMSNLVVGSIPTMQGDRLQRWRPDWFNLVITDEAHFGAADTFKATLDHFKSAYHIFFSATLARHDNQGLWEGVTEKVFSYPLRQAIDDGWLVDYENEEMPVPIVLEDKQAAKAMWTQNDEDSVFSTNNYLPRLFDESAKRCADRHAVLFWANCDASKAADEHFRATGLQSRHVDGYMKDSEIEDFYRWFKEPGPKVAHNADLLSYGYDNPLIDAVGIMRIQRSIGMMKQRIGRATRPLCNVDAYSTAEERKAAIAASPKPKFKIFDLMIQVGEVEHTFADSTALITEDPSEREYLRKAQRQVGRQLSMEEISGALKAKRETDRDKQLAKQAEDAANAARKRQKDHDVFVSDILRDTRGNPGSGKFEGFVRSLAKRHGLHVPMGNGPFTGRQLFLIKERIEKQVKKLEKVS